MKKRTIVLFLMSFILGSTTLFAQEDYLHETNEVIKKRMMWFTEAK